MTQPRFNGVELTAETIERTRAHFVDIYQRCIEEARDGTTRVNDLESYVAWQLDCISEMESGKGDHSFTFLQRAHWLQTGESVPLFAPPNGENLERA